MTVQALGYLGVGAADLDDWTDLATNGLGLQVVDRGAAGRAFRMDDRRQRLILDRAVPEGQRYFGWEVADAAALDGLAARLDQGGVAVRREPAARADQRFVQDLISFADPAGNRLEAFHGAQVADAPFSPGRAISGFRTGALGMGHVLMAVPRLEDSLPFYRDLLGFRISDYIRAPVAACFLHVDRRHHSLALVEAGHSAMHHLMMEFYTLDDVGQNYDIALRGQDRVAVTLGRHSNDLMTSFYQRTPSNFLIECGWGGRDVDDATWKPQEMPTVGSFWGHDGLFRTLGGEARAPGQMPPPPSGRRAPLQVLDGNYERLTGVCPWWDAMTAQQDA